MSSYRFGHPVIDSDGHFVEFFPAFVDYLKAEGGGEILERFGAAWGSSHLNTGWYDLSPTQRRERHSVRPAFWNVPTKNTLDLATAMLPKLMYERLEEIGLDFTVLYPGLGLVAPSFDDEVVRRASCRALNRMYADLFGEFADKMAPTAVIPMHNPAEAIEELEFAVKELGHKVVLMAGHVMRPIPVVAQKYPEAARYAFWLDTYGIDSDYNYDPVWAKCVELKVVPTFHPSSMGWGSRISISNFTYNHIGHFATASEALCKSLFLGGVAQRFPQLKFSFLEGGVGWARSLFADTLGHWEKRNIKAITNYDPVNIDRKLFTELFRRYGGKLTKGRELVEGSELLMSVTGSKEDAATLDDYRYCGIQRKEDIRDTFVEHFYFGCEADDPITASAFNARENPMGARLNAILGSDIGHWDVPDMKGVAHEVHELVEKGVISDADFRDFVFANPIKLWTGLNPDFFKGTAVEKPVSEFLAG